MEFATDWMLNKVKATADQREKVKAIVAATLKDLADVREQHRANRDAFLAALAQPTVDRTTLDHSDSPNCIWPIPHLSAS